MNQDYEGFNSLAVHAGIINDPQGSAVAPIYQTSTFRFNDADHGARCFAGEDSGYIYTRIGNPTIGDLEHAVARLENGYGSIAASSGMAAVNMVYLAFLGQGKHLVAHNSLYGLRVASSRAYMYALALSPPLWMPTMPTMWQMPFGPTQASFI